MKYLIYFYLLIHSIAWSQSSIDELLTTYNTGAIPYISVDELATQTHRKVYLDAREFAEFEISHLKDAIHVGYNRFDTEEFLKKQLSKDQEIVVYCSLGVRSEDIAEKIKALGYVHVYNLKGGIFEWINNNYPVYDSQNQITENVHAFSKTWGKWLTNGIKVYKN